MGAVRSDGRPATAPDAETALEVLEDEAFAAEEAGTELALKGDADRRAEGRAEERILLCDEPPADLGQVDLGNLCHVVLEKFIGRLAGGRGALRETLREISGSTYTARSAYGDGLNEQISHWARIASRKMFPSKVSLSSASGSRKG